jgi:hypothetical protein
MQCNFLQYSRVIEGLMLQEKEKERERYIIITMFFFFEDSLSFSVFSLKLGPYLEATELLLYCFFFLDLSQRWHTSNSVWVDTVAVVKLFIVSSLTRLCLALLSNFSLVVSSV